MSTTEQTQTYSCDRDGCETERTAAKMVAGSFCSRRCYLKHKGSNQLDNIKYDHRWCHGCFRKCKEIERPGDGHSVVVGPVDHDALADTCRDVLVGYQHLTCHARHGEKTGRGIVELDESSPHRDQTPAPADTLVMTGTICECGTTDHRDEYLRAENVTSAREAAKRLARALVFTGHEGQHDKTFDVRTLARTLRESAEEHGEFDWELAVGRAIKN